MYTKDYIETISYTDFVGLINQWNVLPGSHTTLSKWRVFSQLNEKSKLLEIACTTGFSSRELASQSGCSGEGIDISEKSVAMANYNMKLYAPSINFIYTVADGYTYTSVDKFSHIVVGAALGFFPDPKKMLDHCVSLLADGGYILASPFYVSKAIPNDLLQKAKQIFGITPTQVPYKEIMELYKDLEIIFEDRNEIIQETEDELTHYCTSTIDRAVSMLNITDTDVRDAMYSRLYEIKRMSNDLRPYQKFSTLVLRYRSDIYPNRFVELF
jgi:SAM-dependent methyltransferase